MNRIILNVDNVSQWFGENRILHNVNLQVVQGQFVALVGPSGCGKSTLLRAILGTQPPKAGTVSTNGIRVMGPNRHVGIVYQKYSLYEFLTAEENVAFGLMLDNTNFLYRWARPFVWRKMKRSHLEQAREILVKFKLGHALKSYPSQLSGGMQQRVAIAQALVMKPSILLLDEPFGALDEATREELQEMLLELYQENLQALKNKAKPPHTVILITHELNEAFYVADRVVGLSRNWSESVEASEPRFGAACGATKVYDKCAPVYHPDDPRDFELFHDLKVLLRKVVFDPENINQDPTEHVSFWSDLENGVGTGVSIIKEECYEP